ncbi:hypothetical protein DYB37_010775 [Aphanomyces astaci]|uniref:Apple domain-containing protein n=1 Tax=Aphanomyces astaci TaxID=112090 RepID=A0A3R7BUC6_APHAT|nr:hypothetical protein DYB37_010775 [Aphanomyces astaci]
MKTAFVLSIVAVATAAQDKIWPSVLRSIQQTSTASVAVTIDDLNAQKDSSVFDWAKCKGLENEPVLLCNDLTKEEINSLAALPNVQKITNVADSSAPCPLNITPKPADTPTTTAETINPCPPNITPKPTTTAAAPITTSAAPTTTAAAPSACDKPVEGIDYDGKDIKSTKRSNSDDCCNDCAKTPGCVLYVWTNWNSGTCFLKSKAGKSILKWGAKAGKVTKPAKVIKPAGSCEVTQDNMDYEGNDITSTQHSNSDDCCDDCAKTPGCVLYVWTQWNDGTCFLKSSAGNSVPKWGVKAAKVTKPAKVIKPAGSCEVTQDNVDYEGNDITSTQRSNSDDCCDDCAKTPGCVLYVWTNWNSGTCFLKSKAGKSILKWGAKAGKVTKPAKVIKPAGSCKAAQDNVDYNGNDIARISADKEDCCALCVKAENCVGYSHYEGHCYLKGKLGYASKKEGVTSGVRD